MAPSLLSPDVPAEETLPSIPKSISLPQSTPPLTPHEEHQYLDLIRNILANGEHRPDRYIALNFRTLENLQTNI